MIDAIATLSGREKDRRQYEQLLQRLAELLVIRQVVTYPWPFAARYRWAPTAAGNKKNSARLAAQRGVPGVGEITPLYVPAW
jgi:hypothetical protein